jgi:hypothetical protein
VVEALSIADYAADTRSTKQRRFDEAIEPNPAHSDDSDNQRSRSGITAITETITERLDTPEKVVAAASHRPRLAAIRADIERDGTDG